MAEDRKCHIQRRRRTGARPLPVSEGRRRGGEGVGGERRCRAASARALRESVGVVRGGVCPALSTQLTVCVCVCVCLSLSIPGDCTLKTHPIQCTSLTQPQTLVLGRWRTRRCFLEGAAAVAAAAAALLLPLHQVPALGALPSLPRIISRLCWSSRRLHLLQQLQQRVHSRHLLIHKA